MPSHDPSHRSDRRPALHRGPRPETSLDAGRAGGEPPHAGPRFDTQRRRLAAQSVAVRDAVAAMVRVGLIERRPVDRELAAYLRERKHFGGRDRRLISEAVYGVLRWWGWLQRLVPPGAPLPQDAAGWDALILGAAVLEPVGDADMLAFWAGEAGIDARCPALASPSDDPVRRASELFAALHRGELLPLRRASLIPQWALPQIRPPRPVDELIDWMQKRPPLWLRLQGPQEAVLAELRDAGLQAEVPARVRSAVSIRQSRINLFSLPLYRARRVEVQDLASQCVGQVCAPRPGERWWDACAGGGGKSLLLAQLMEGRGAVVATDVREHKLQEVRHRSRLAGFQNISTRPWNGRALSPRQATFDGVLVDAPCSGAGTWRRNPWARWSLRPEDVTELQELQRRILRNAASGVKAGGVLVYATCSMFAAENEEVIGEFVATHPDFAAEPFPHPLADGQAEGALQIWPWDGDCDAMYVARLRRR